MDTPPPAASPPPSGTTRTAALQHGVRFALGTLTVLPVRVTRWDRGAARAGMLCAPVAGLAVGLAAAAASWPAHLLGYGPLLAAVLAAAVPAVLTRGLHLDGLADVADGLGSGRPAHQALAVMKRSDTGPFGVVTLVFVLLTQVAALQELFARGPGTGAAGTVAAALASRTALTWACRAGVPAARPEGLGAAVAGCVPVRAAGGVVTAAVLAGAAAGALGAAASGGGVAAAGVLGACAVVSGLGAAEVLLRRCRRRFGGLTGDVLGAAAEAATTAALLVLALGTGS